MKAGGNLTIPPDISFEIDPKTQVASSLEENNL